MGIIASPEESGTQGQETTVGRSADFSKFAAGLIRHAPPLSRIDPENLFFAESWQLSPRLRFTRREYYQPEELPDANPTFSSTAQILLQGEHDGNGYYFSGLEMPLEGNPRNKISINFGKLRYLRSQSHPYPFSRICIGPEAYDDPSIGARNQLFYIDYKGSEQDLPDCFIDGQNIFRLFFSGSPYIGANAVEALKTRLQGGAEEKDGIQFSLIKGKGPLVRRGEDVEDLDLVRIVKKDPEDPKGIIYDITIPVGMIGEDTKNIIGNLIGSEVLKDPLNTHAKVEKRLFEEDPLGALGIKVATPGIETPSSRAFQDTVKLAVASLPTEE